MESFRNFIKKKIRRCANDNTGSFSIEEPFMDVFFIRIPEIFNSFLEGNKWEKCKTKFLKSGQTNNAAD